MSKANRNRQLHMTLVQINRPKRKSTAPTADSHEDSKGLSLGGILFSVGFRPFFFGATLFSILSMLLWMNVYFLTDPPTFVAFPENISIRVTQWHSHEMIYGYCMAVIAGFLLTAVSNWTGQKPLSGAPLATLFILWAGARISFLTGTSTLLVGFVMDLSFHCLLVFFIAMPIIAVRQWRQLGVLTKLLGLALGNLCFYLGGFQHLQNGATLGIYAGLYLIISLILTIGERVVPPFIQNGVEYEVTIRSSRMIQVVGFLLFLLFFLNELFFGSTQLRASTSLCLFLLNLKRLYNWHTRGIWLKPLLWGLYLAFVSIDLGFLLFFLSSYGIVSELVALHSFAVGGIGFATLAMMSRVTLGHTGRSVRTPPQFTAAPLLLLGLVTFSRVLLPIVDGVHYSNWIFVSQCLWVTAFSVFLLLFGRMCVSE